MARTSYQAPGVYVEEIPSARQPIAGVGTNTAGFIGIVDDWIFIPVANTDYDPVAAEAAFVLDPQNANASAEDRAQATRALRQSFDHVLQRYKQLDTRIGELAKAPTEGRAQRELEDLRKQQTQQHDAITDLLARLPQEERDKVSRDVPAAPAPAPAPGAGAEGSAAATGSAGPRPSGPTEAEATSGPSGTTAGGPAPGASGARGSARGTGTAAASTAAAAGTGDFTNAMTAAGLRREELRPSPLRPYYFDPRQITVEPFDTKLCTNFREYADRFGDFSGYKPPGRGQQANLAEPMSRGHHALTHAVNGFFQNGGTRCFVARIKERSGLRDALAAFESIDEIALIAAPGVVDPRSPELDAQLAALRPTWDALITHATKNDNCFAILDSPRDIDAARTENRPPDLDIQRLSYGGMEAVLPPPSKDAAYYFPNIEVVDPAKELQDQDIARQVPPKYRGRTYVPPSGHVTGIYARTDEERGVHKAPANAVVRGAIDLRYYISKAKQELLNPQGVNCIRNMNGNIAVWGARTIGGDRNSEWKYVPVRRLFLYLRESIDEGTQWVVFEPNDRALWGKIILNVSAFLTNVWRSGALFGNTPEEAFYVKCDDELNPPEVRDVGQVITEIGVAIVRPAEFVIFRITQATSRQAP